MKKNSTLRLLLAGVFISFAVAPVMEAGLFSWIGRSSKKCISSIYARKKLLLFTVALIYTGYCLYKCYKTPNQFSDDNASAGDTNGEDIRADKTDFRSRWHYRNFTSRTNRRDDNRNDNVNRDYFADYARNFRYPNSNWACSDATPTNNTDNPTLSSTPVSSSFPKKYEADFEKYKEEWTAFGRSEEYLKQILMQGQVGVNYIDRILKNHRSTVLTTDNNVSFDQEPDGKTIETPEVPEVPDKPEKTEKEKEEEKLGIECGICFDSPFEEDSKITEDELKKCSCCSFKLCIHCIPALRDNICPQCEKIFNTI